MCIAGPGGPDVQECVWLRFIACFAPLQKNSQVNRGFSMMDGIKDWQGSLLARIADALERMAPPRRVATDPAVAEAFVWDAGVSTLKPVERVNRLDISLLRGIDAARDTLLEHTRRFARGLPANNALLWGARGMGKSSLVKAVHGTVARDGDVLKLVEIHREDIETLPELMAVIRSIRNSASSSSVTTSPSMAKIAPTSR